MILRIIFPAYYSELILFSPSRKNHSPDNQQQKLLPCREYHAIMVTVKSFTW